MSKPIKPPAGYKVRLGAYLSHGKRAVHVVCPDGFKFTWDMSEGFGSNARQDTIKLLHEREARAALAKAQA